MNATMKRIVPQCCAPTLQGQLCVPDTGGGNVKVQATVNAINGFWFQVNAMQENLALG